MPYIEELIDDLIKLEKKKTFTEEQLKEWIHLVKNRKNNSDWDIPCPCSLYDIKAGSVECPEREIVLEDFLEDESSYKDFIAWAHDMDYCSCNCRRSDIYHDIKSELYERLEYLDLKDEYEMWMDYLISELENLL